MGNVVKRIFDQISRAQKEVTCKLICHTQDVVIGEQEVVKRIGKGLNEGRKEERKEERKEGRADGHMID